MIRNLTSQSMFTCLAKYCVGHVLDLGGAWFYRYVKNKSLNFTSWTSLDIDEQKLRWEGDPKHRVIVGDGCNLPLPSESVDTVLNIQVLEHVMEPLKMVSEIGRVLKYNGHAILLIPQTACVHQIPCVYYNFTYYFIEEALKSTRLKMVEYHALGGSWRTILFRHVCILLQASRIPGYSCKKTNTRNLAFYVLFPLMVAYIVISMPLLMLFSLGDLIEEPNNHLVVVRKVPKETQPETQSSQTIGI